MTVNTAFGVSTPVNSRSINNAFDAVLNNGYDFSNIVATGSVTAATFVGNGASITALNASNLSSGTVPTARISGSYTGITGIGTLTTNVTTTANVIINNGSPTIYLQDTDNRSSMIHCNSNTFYVLRGNGNNSTTWATVGGYWPLEINLENNNATFGGTLFAAGTLTGARFITNNASPSLELGDWSASLTWSAVDGYNGYLLLGNTSDRAVYLRSNTTAPVRLGANGTNALIVNAENNYDSVTTTGGIESKGAYAGLYFENRTNVGEKFAWYSTGGDGFLYSSYIGGNVIGVARTTGITYLYKGIAGIVQYGSYGSVSVYGTTGGYGGITFPDQTSTMMVQNNLFGHYRNNTTWNFYVSGGTYVPSDARYKRDIQPLEHGMNFIRHITPVSYDPLTENLDDDPETTIGKTHYGFTTQNILQALTNAGEMRDVAIVDIGGPATQETNSDRQYLNYTALIAPIVKAIQELDVRLEQLETI